MKCAPTPSTESCSDEVIKQKASAMNAETLSMMFQEHFLSIKFDFNFLWLDDEENNVKIYRNRSRFNRVIIPVWLIV